MKAPSLEPMSNVQSRTSNVQGKQAAISRADYFLLDLGRWRLEPWTSDFGLWTFLLLLLGFLKQTE
jgi:hypothetical protein